MTELLLEDMLVNARSAQDFVCGFDVAAFEADLGTRYAATQAMIYVVGAAAQIDASVRNSIASMPWDDPEGMKRLVHDYRQTEPTAVFATIREDFPPLIAEPERLLSQEAKA